MASERLRRGDIVEVRSPAEILATLDARGMLGGLPFMPEMLPFCGRRFVVDKRADKICDTMATARSREMPDTVLLEDLRCDGSGHDGCQAECHLFWKEAWLRKVDSREAPGRPVDEAGLPGLRALVERTAKQPPTPTYTCQATEHYRASVRLRSWDPRPYLREFVSGNVGLKELLIVVGRALVQEPRRRLGLRGPFPVLGPRTSGVSLSSLDLQPGERVRVKTKDEIAATLTREGENHGVWFDDENIPFCGGTFRVHQRINRVIDEHTGQMLELDKDKDWLSLQGVVCSGSHSVGRWFCPRAFPVQWTEDWLTRADPEP